MEFDAYKMTKTSQAKADKKRAMRVNDKSTGTLKFKDLKAHASIREYNPYVPREREEREALPRTTDWRAGGVYDGAELKPFEGRPGAMDFKRCPSRGIAA